MKELRHLDGTVVLDDAVARSLEKFGDALAARRMSASLTIYASGEAAIKVDVGYDTPSMADQALHAKPPPGEASHFDTDEI